MAGFGEEIEPYLQNHFCAILVLHAGSGGLSMGTAVSLRLPEELRTRLDKLAKLTGRSKTYYMIEAISEKLEDLEDLYLAEERTRALRAGRPALAPGRLWPALRRLRIR